MVALPPLPLTLPSRRHGSMGDDKTAILIFGTCAKWWGIIDDRSGGGGGGTAAGIRSRRKAEGVAQVLKGNHTTTDGSVNCHASFSVERGCTEEELILKYRETVTKHLNWRVHFIYRWISQIVGVGKGMNNCLLCTKGTVLIEAIKVKKR